MDSIPLSCVGYCAVQSSAHKGCCKQPLLPQVQGGGLRDSFLVDGVAFKKTFSYAGFEMQPKAYDSPRILLLNIELELKSEKENAEVGACACSSQRKAVQRFAQLHYSTEVLFRLMLPTDISLESW